MAVLLITTRGVFLPDEDNLGKWETLPRNTDFYTLRVGPHRLFVRECFVDESVKMKPLKKHNEIASWIDIISQYVKEKEESVSSDDIYLICHDKDLLRNMLTDEGIFPESEVLGELKGKIRDGHIYVFQHVYEQDMFKAIIKNLSSGPIESNVNQAIAIIKDCTYEISNS